MRVHFDDRTIRYHLSNLEKDGLVTRLGRKGVLLTPDGSEEARAIFVFDRIGMSSMETEMLIVKSDLDLCANKGKVIETSLLCQKKGLTKHYPY